MTIPGGNWTRLLTTSGLRTDSLRPNPFWICQGYAKPYTRSTNDLGHSGSEVGIQSCQILERRLQSIYDGSSRCVWRTFLNQKKPPSTILGYTRSGGMVRIFRLPRDASSIRKSCIITHESSGERDNPSSFCIFQDFNTSSHIAEITLNTGTSQFTAHLGNRFLWD
jgi:hypothetical protein